MLVAAGAIVSGPSGNANDVAVAEMLGRYPDQVLSVIGTSLAAGKWRVPGRVPLAVFSAQSIPLSPVYDALARYVVSRGVDPADAHRALTHADSSCTVDAALELATLL